MKNGVSGEELQVLVQYQLIAALQEREHDLAEAQRLARLGSWSRDVASGLSVWSNELWRILDPEPTAEPSIETFLACVHPGDRSEVRRIITQAETPPGPSRYEYECRCINGASERWVRVLGEVEADGNGTLRCHGTVQDISTEVATRAAIEEERQRLAVLALVEGARSVTEYDRDGGVRHLRTYGDRSEGPSRPMVDLLRARESLHPADVARIEKEVARLLRVPGSKTVTRGRLSDGVGSWVPFEARGASHGEGPSTRAIVSLHDLPTSTVVGGSASPDRDPLTGLASHALLLAYARAAAARAVRNAWCTAVFVIDIDDFHGINVARGYEVGDAVIIEVADCLARTLRGSDLVGRFDIATVPATDSVARFGGDRFVAVCENVGDADAARAIAERINRVIGLVKLGGGDEVGVTVGMGIAIAGPSDASIEHRVHDAEDALRMAKKVGPGQHVVVEQGAKTGQEHRRREAEGLRRAITGGEFVLHYQPKVAFDSDRITGVEALVRWDHPVRGLIAPLEFVPLAEETGLIVPVGSWVLEEACRQAAIWNREYPGQPPLVVSVNVSGRQFNDGLMGVVEAAVAAAGIDPAQLCLEVTESTLISDANSAVEILHGLAALGVHLSIDDFGTGYSSLSYLKRFPLHELKIDKSFVDGLGSDSNDTAIVAATVAMAHALGLSVVAEGVESADQFDRLRVIGCQEAQGYFISRPVPAHLMSQMLELDAAGGWRAGRLAQDDAERVGVGPLRILVVDDAGDVRQLARMALAATGFEVYEATGGAEAIRLANELLPDCVVLDVSMPGMSGTDVCRALRASPRTSHCTIVMLTSNSGADDKIEAFGSGADDYIIKPFSPRDLVSRVWASLRRNDHSDTRAGASS